MKIARFHPPIYFKNILTSKFKSDIGRELLLFFSKKMRGYKFISAKINLGLIEEDTLKSQLKHKEINQKELQDM